MISEFGTDWHISSSLVASEFIFQIMKPCFGGNYLDATYVKHRDNQETAYFPDKYIAQPYRFFDLSRHVRIPDNTMASSQVYFTTQLFSYTLTEY